MSKTSRYVTSCLYLVSLGLIPVGCGGSKGQTCPPLVSADAAGRLTGGVTGDASASGRVGADAAVNGAVDASATARGRLPPTDAELKEAAELRARARANIDAGRLREALPDLERAFALTGDVTLLGDLGLALQAAGRLEESWVAFYRFRAEARAAYEPIRAKIDASIGELEKQLGGLLIDTDTPGAEIVVRGQVVARLPLATPIFLAPGDVAVIVRAAGKPDFTVRSRVAIGAVARANANFTADRPGVVAGVGGALGGVGGALGGVGGTLKKPTGVVGGTLGGVGGALGGVGGTVGRPNGSVGGTVPSVSGPDVPSANLGAPAVGAVGGVAGGLGAPAITPPVPPAPPIWPIVVGVGGIAVVGGAIAASVVHSGRLDNFDAKLCGKEGASAECPAIESGLKVTTGLQVTGYLLGGIALTAGIVAFAVTRSAPDLDCPKIGKAAPLQLRCGVGADGTSAGMGCVGAF